MSGQVEMHNNKNSNNSNNSNRRSVLLMHCTCPIHTSTVLWSMALLLLHEDLAPTGYWGIFPPEHLLMLEYEGVWMSVLFHMYGGGIGAGWA